jgi:hypothetical protein
MREEMVGEERSEEELTIGRLKFIYDEKDY